MAHDEQIIEEMNTANFRNDPETESEEGHIVNDDNIVTTHRYNLRPRPTKHHNRLNLMQVTQQLTCADSAKPHLHVLMTQMSVKFGKRVDNAVSKELRQLHDRKAMVPICKDDMSAEDRHVHQREKRRGFADGRPQRQYTEKGDTSSLTVSLEAMMMSCCVDANEGQYVSVADIPGAFLHADMNE